jgi:CheY-like chemotaxis protein
MIEGRQLTIGTGLATRFGAHDLLRGSVANGKLVLCIDDEPSVLAIHKLVLESAGYTVAPAATGQDGLTLFAAQPVDAVLLDYKLPDFDGGAVAASMRNTKSAIPIVMLSANQSVPENAAQWIDVFVSKGGSPKVWLNALAELLELSTGARLSPPSAIPCRAPA